MNESAQVTGRRRFSPPWPEAFERRRLPWPAAALGAVRASLRLMGIVCLLVCIAAHTAWVYLVERRPVGSGSETVARRRRFYCSLMLRALGGRLNTRGAVPPGPGLLVANHHSWLDGIAVAMARSPAFTAYGRDWPLVGFILKRIGVVEIPRGLGKSLPRALETVRKSISAGELVCVFPEATTSFGPEPLEFKPAFFQTALDSGSPIYACAIRYSTLPPWPSPERVLHWVDWTPFLIHAARVASLPGFTVDIAFSPALAESAHNRRDLKTERKRLAVQAWEEVTTLLLDNDGSKLPSRP